MKKNIKVVGVISSARFRGNTATLVREVLKGAEESGAIITARMCQGQQECAKGTGVLSQEYCSKCAKGTGVLSQEY